MIADLKTAPDGIFGKILGLAGLNKLVVAVSLLEVETEGDEVDLPAVSVLIGVSPDAKGVCLVDSFSGYKDLCC